MFARGLRRTRWLAGLFLLFMAVLAGAQAVLPIPPLGARVTDLTATLSADQRSRLEEKIAAFERQKGAQIAVLIVPSVLPETVTEYALRVVESWKLGRKGVDDGALLLVAKDDRKMRIEVGYGLEGALNDATAKRIISETISPRFKQGDFYGGIDAGLEVMIKVAGGEALPEPKQASKTNEASGGIDFETLMFFGFILVFVVGGILRAIFGRFLAAGVVGGVAGIIASLILSSVLVAIVVGAVAFIVSLFAGISGGGGGIGGGGFSSGGSSWGGGSGGGGFSGGGGSFGGGGASGDW
ncbi:YgcG family protein [Propionivibrio sp.]|uniref:TPM domain-containing protein n=1 Tax=Propionivibrio sp. TaxID=2212460 RepID=UPI0025DCAA7D|nr:YgcG family protein [Propionivibrio sp.]